MKLFWFDVIFIDNSFFFIYYFLNVHNKYANCFSPLCWQELKLTAWFITSNHLFYFFLKIGTLSSLFETLRMSYWSSWSEHILFIYTNQNIFFPSQSSSSHFCFIMGASFDMSSAHNWPSFRVKQNSIRLSGFVCQCLHSVEKWT